MLNTLIISLFVSLSLATNQVINVTFTLQGTTTTIMGTEHDEGRSFYAIPYARAPIGALRFKARLTFPCYGACALLASSGNDHACLC